LVWKYFSKLDEIAECNICNKKYKTSNIKDLETHLIHVYKISNNKKDYLKKENDTNDVIWQYFSKQNGYAAQCNCKVLLVHCKVLLQFVYYRTNLTRDQEIWKNMVEGRQKILAQTQLSQHFIFENLHAICKMCNYKINIFCNKSDLERHAYGIHRKHI